MHARLAAVGSGLALVAVIGATGQARGVRLEAAGLKGGAAYVSADFQYEGTEIVEPSAIVQPTAGVFAEWRWSRRSRFNVVTEVSWVRKGYEADRSSIVVGASNPPRQVTADFLSVPVLLRSNVRSSDLSLYLFFGPSVEVLLRHDDDPILDRYHDLAIAGYAGLGFELELDRRASLLAELRFDSEFTNVYDSREGDPLIAVRHRILELLGGVRF
jgi:hypothetical protein